MSATSKRTPSAALISSLHAADANAKTTMKPFKLSRFSIRTLLIATVCVAVFVVYLLAPTYLAVRFMRAVVDGNVNDARAMLDQSISSRSEHWVAIVKSCANPQSKRDAHLEPLSLSDFLSGRRNLVITFNNQTSGEQYQFYATGNSIRRGIKLGGWIE